MDRTATFSFLVVGAECEIKDFPRRLYSVHFVRNFKLREILRFL